MKLLEYLPLDPRVWLLATLLLPAAVVGQDTSSVQSYEGPCNLDLYQAWYDAAYTGKLLSYTNFWIFKDAPISNGLAMERASVQCYLRLNQLRLDRAGRHGPVEDWWIYDIMCGEICTESDKLRRNGMLVSGCDCLELSVKETEMGFVAPGNWCAANTGRMLCNIFDQCGVWACSLNDFMCPRYEYNKYLVPLRGYGSCSGAVSLKVAFWSLAFIALTTAVMYML